MSTNINNSAYSTLNTYSVLSSSGITSANTTTITNGYYGSTKPSYTGSFVGTVNTTDASKAQGQLITLIAAIDFERGFAPTIQLTGTTSTPITLKPNVDYSGSGITFEGSSITLDAEGDSNAKFYITSLDAITFNNVSSITLKNGASTCNIFWLAYSVIKFTGTSPSYIPGIFISATKITFENASQVVGRLYAQTSNITFSGTSLVNGICTETPQNVVCYAKGTLILTKQGFVPIENIRAGNKVVTKGKILNNKFIDKDAPLQLDPVMWISKFKVTNLNTDSKPICIKKDALGQNQPFKDLYVSPNHGLIVKGKMVLAKNMVNEKTIYQDEDCVNVEYYHLECENHSAIIANGILSESYLEINNRDVFENSIRLHHRKSDFKKKISIKYL